MFDSWNTERAIIYRRQERIPADLGTAVNVQTMVFGNVGEGSGTGVAFTRDPATGHPACTATTCPTPRARTSWRASATPLPLSALADTDQAAHDELLAIMDQLEKHYKDLCDIEFTVERRKLWMPRPASASAPPQLRSGSPCSSWTRASSTWTRPSAGSRGAAGTADVPAVRVHQRARLAATGMGASPGAAVGEVVFDSPSAAEAAADGRQVILVRRETNPDDLQGMVAAAGVLTSRGGKTSHAAVVARGWARQPSAAPSRWTSTRPTGG